MRLFHPLIAVLLLLALPTTSAAPSSGLAERVEALASSDPDPATWSALLEDIEAAGERRLLARAHGLRCMRQVVSAPAAAGAHAEQGLAVAGDDTPAERAGLLVCRGYLAESAGRVAAAIDDYEQAIVLAESGGDRATQAQALALRGEQRHLRGEYAAALEDLQAAYALQLDVGNERGQSYALNAIANLYADSHVAQYDQALAYYRKLADQHRAAGRTDELATNQFNIASTLERAGRHAEAISAFRETLRLYQSIDDPDSLAQTRRALAAVLLRDGEPAEALALLAPARSHAEAGADADFLARIALTEGAALRRLDRAEDALVRLDAARLHFAGVDNPRFLETIEDERAEALALLGRWREAHDARRAQLHHAQRLAGQLREEHTSRMRVQFDSERKEEDNRALQRENRLRAEALVAAERIRSLQSQVLALAALLIVVLAAVAIRAARRARRMRRLALTDELTGLPNRRSILAELQEARSQPAGAGVLLLDIDHFKAINDRLGHEAGDVVLRRVAELGQQALGRDGTLGRLGGEEFLAVLQAEDAVLAVAAERLRAAVESADLTRVADGLRVTVSIGIARSLPTDARIEDAVQRADAALYRAKAGGRNRVVRDEAVAG